MDPKDIFEAYQLKNKGILRAISGIQMFFLGSTNPVIRSADQRIERIIALPGNEGTVGSLAVYALGTDYFGKRVEHGFLIPILTQNGNAVYLFSSSNDLRYRREVAVNCRNGLYFLDLKIDGIWFSSDPQVNPYIDSENIIKYITGRIKYPHILNRVCSR